MAKGKEGKRVERKEKKRKEIKEKERGNHLRNTFQATMRQP